MLIIYGDDRYNGSFPVATTLIITACVVLFVYCATHPGTLEYLFLIPSHLADQDYYPLITATFVHAGLFHIAVNMFVLWAFARSVEDRIGPLPFICLYLGAGVGAALLYCFLHQNSPIPVLGASGAIYGVMGAYLAFFPKQKLKAIVWFFTPLKFEIPAYLVIIAYSIIEFLSIENEDAGNIGHSAHIGGFLFGLIIGLICLDDDKNKKNKSYV